MVASGCIELYEVARYVLDRLREIFADRGDEIHFEAVDGTLHEGFVDHAAKVCVFTDHQIFDRSLCG